MFAKAFIIVSFCVAASLQDWITDLPECGEGIPTPKKLYVENCFTFPCPAYVGWHLNAEMKVDAPYDVTVLTSKVSFRLSDNFYIPYSLGSKNVCIRPKSNINDCPYSAGEEILHSTSMPVPALKLNPGEYYNVTVQYALLDQKNNILCCLRAPLQVMNYSQDSN